MRGISSGRFVIEQADMQEFRLWGLTIQQIKTAIDWAKERGWTEGK